MALGSGIANVARVAFEARTSEFFRDLDRAEAHYRQTLSSMSADARRFTSAQDRLTVATGRYGAQSQQAARASAALRSSQRGLADQTVVTEAAQTRLNRAQPTRFVAAGTTTTSTSGDTSGAARQVSAQRAQEHQSIRTRVAQERLNRAIARYGPDSHQAARATGSLERAQRSLQRQTDRTQRSLSQTARGALGASGAFGGLSRTLAFASGAFLGGAGITYAIRSSVKAASDLAEEVDKAKMVFLAGAPDILAWGKTTTNALGLSERAALQAAGSFGNMFRTIGRTGPEAAEMSKAFVKLGVDMASFNNEDPSEMLERLRSGLAGEAEALRRFGVFLSEGTTKTEAYRVGIAKSGAELTEQQKVQARYSLILRQTAIQHDNYALTSANLAGQQRKLAANIEGVQVLLGQALIPTVLDLVTRLNNWLAVSENQERLQHDITKGVEIFVGVLRTSAHVIDTVADAVGGLGNLIKLLLTLMVVSKVAKFTTAILELGTAATIASGGAAGGSGVGLLLTRLRLLKAIGPIAIAVGVTYTITKILEDLTGEQLPGTNDPNFSASNQTNPTRDVNGVWRSEDGKPVTDQAYWESKYQAGLVTKDGAGTVGGVDPTPGPGSSNDRPDYSPAYQPPADPSLPTGVGGANDPDAIEKVALPDSLSLKEAQARRSESTTRIRAALKEQLAFYSWVLRTKKLTVAARAAVINDLIAVENELIQMDAKAASAADDAAKAAADARAASFELPENLSEAAARAALTKSDADDLKNLRDQRAFYTRQLQRARLSLSERRQLYEALGSVNDAITALEQERAQRAADAAEARAAALAYTEERQDLLIERAKARAGLTLDESDDIKALKDEEALVKRRLARLARRVKLSNEELAQQVALLQRLAGIRKELADTLAEDAKDERRKSMERLFLSERASFFGSFAPNTFQQSLAADGSIVRSAGSNQRPQITVVQNFPNPPTEDGNREATYAYVATQAAHE